MGNIISLLSGRDLDSSQYNSSAQGIPYITGASNFNTDRLKINRWTQSPVTISIRGDLLITCKGTIGTMSFNNIGDIHIARQVMAINGFANLEYIRIFLSLSVSILNSKANSMIPGISRHDILSLLIPLPPMKEQHRIVEKVKEIDQLL